MGTTELGMPVKRGSDINFFCIGLLQMGPDETQFYVTLQYGDGISLHITRYFLACRQNGYHRIRYAC